MNKPARQNSLSQNSLSQNSLSYADAGVDIDAGNALVDAIKAEVKTTRRPGADSEIGGFGGLFDLKAAGFDDPVLVAANDGVGTKLKIAIETGHHETIGIDLVAMCVNDLIVQGAEPLFFLDYLATGRLDVATAKTIIAGIAEGCRQAGCALIGGETAEMPGMYHGADYDLAGFAVGAAERGRLLPRDDIGQGDIVLGLAASGVHSNGFSLVRKLMKKNDNKWSDPAPFAEGQNLGEVFLTPTRIYVRSILAALKAGVKIKALAHITGGGFTENIPRVLPDNLGAEIDLAHLPFLPVFKWMMTSGNIAQAEMLRTFNCGIGMVLIAAPDEAKAIAELLETEGETVHLLSRIIARKDNAVTYKGQLQI